MARRMLRIAVAASVNEREFSNWGHILGTKRCHGEEAAAEGRQHLHQRARHEEGEDTAPRPPN